MRDWFIYLNNHTSYGFRCNVALLFVHNKYDADRLCLIIILTFVSISVDSIFVLHNKTIYVYYCCGLVYGVCHVREVKEVSGKLLEGQEFQGSSKEIRSFFHILSEMNCYICLHNSWLYLSEAYSTCIQIAKMGEIHHHIKHESLNSQGNVREKSGKSIS